METRAGREETESMQATGEERESLDPPRNVSVSAYLFQKPTRLEYFE